MIKLEIIWITDYLIKMFISLEYYYCVYIVNYVRINLHCKIYYKRLKENDFIEERMKLYFVIRNTVLLFRNYTKDRLVFSRHWYFFVYRRINARKNEK